MIRPISRRRFAEGLLATSAIVSASVLPLPLMAAGDKLTVYKSPTCGCCQACAQHMQRAGFELEIVEIEDLAPIKARLRVPQILEACHTAVVGGYVIEGHVPATDVERLLRERPKAMGLAVPGMPIGSPGMEQDGRREPFETILFSRQGLYVFAHHT